MNRDNKKKDILELVNKLPDVKVSGDFNEKVYKRIAERQREREKESSKKIIEAPKGILEIIIGKFRKPYLVPAIGLLALLLIVLYFIFKNRESSLDENKIIITQKTDSIEKLSPEVILPQDSSAKIEESQKEKLPGDKAKPITTKKKNVEVRAKQNETETILPEEKKIDKKFATTNEPTVKTRDTSSDKEIAIAENKNEKITNDGKKNLLDEKINSLNETNLESLSKKIKSLFKH